MSKIENIKQGSQDRGLRVQHAEYAGGLRLAIWFNDKKQTVVDFSEYLNTQAKGYLAKYKNPNAFKSFKIENGNLVWGKDWDLVFPVHQLHEGHIK